MTAAKGKRLRLALIWTFKAILALLFFTFGMFKLMGTPMMIHEFDQIGLGQAFRVVTGLIEVGGAILLLVPPASRFAVLPLLGVSVGAFIVQATTLHGDVMHTLILIAATGLLSYLSWRSKKVVD